MIITHTYHGYELSTSYYQKARRYYPAVSIKPNIDEAVPSEIKPPCAARGYATKDEALILGIEYARAAVDGKIKHFCTSSLQYKQTA